MLLLVSPSVPTLPPHRDPSLEASHRTNSRVARALSKFRTPNHNARKSDQADVLNSPLVIVARTDAEAATMIDSNIAALSSLVRRVSEVSVDIDESDYEGSGIWSFRA